MTIIPGHRFLHWKCICFHSCKTKSVYNVCHSHFLHFNPENRGKSDVICVGWPKLPLRADTSVEPLVFHKLAWHLREYSNPQRWGASDYKSKILTFRPQMPLSVYSRWNHGTCIAIFSCLHNTFNCNKNSICHSF